MLQDSTNNVTGSSGAMMDTPRKKQKNNRRATGWAQRAAQGCVPASVTDSSIQSELSTQTSNTIVGAPIEHLQSFTSSPPGPKHRSTAELAGVFRATEEREEKQSRFQEELLAEMRKQTTAVEEMVRVVKELYSGGSYRASDVVCIRDEREEGNL
jgi:hypothetical protein